MRNRLGRAVRSIYGFFGRMSLDRIGIYTAQASFFIILSIFPFLLLFLNILGMTNINPNTILHIINTYSPDTLQPLLTQIFQELYTHVSGTAISIAAITAIWSASKGVLSVMFGLYEIYKIHRNRNYFISRFISMIYTVLFVITIIFTMVILVFGNKLFNFAISLLPALQNITILTIILRYLVTFLLLFIFFVSIYRISNIKLCTFYIVTPGAVFVWKSYSFYYIDSLDIFLYIYLIYRCGNKQNFTSGNRSKTYAVLTDI